MHIDYPYPAEAAVYLLDCDTGIDDAVALLYLLADPAIDLAAITVTFGNVTASQAADNTLRLLHRVGRSDIPVAVGSELSMSGGTLVDRGQGRIHGTNGIGDVQLPPSPVTPVAELAPQLIVRLARENPGELHIIATGVCTNLADALELDPELPKLVASVTMMGGAALVPGNATAAAEANIIHDPVAAARVLRANWPVTLVPLDVTMLDVVEEADWRQLREATGTVGELAAQMMDVYMDFYVGVFGRRAAACHDVLAAAIAVGDIQATLAPVVDVVIDTTEGPGMGQTICDLRGRFRGFQPEREGGTRVVLETDERVVPRLIERLTSY
ncbi:MULTISPECIES: nucleoside hydrolase [unclassified Salinibacterium]|uniref:nucleoside hydrolase n=1 Tax=unclassified Salinibacterium TaxID=2632331 RepID=UPI001CD3DF20|nr:MULTISPECIES: nucleoside hydrolase [unclassified Salinibacterium]